MPAEFNISFQRFAQMVKLGEPDHVMLGPLKTLHGTEKHTAIDWWTLLHQLKVQPATSGVKRIG